MLQPMGSQRVGHDWATEQQQQQCLFNGIIMQLKYIIQLKYHYLFFLNPTENLRVILSNCSSF